MTAETLKIISDAGVLGVLILILVFLGKGIPTLFAQMGQQRQNMLETFKSEQKEARDLFAKELAEQRETFRQDSSADRAAHEARFLRIEGHLTRQSELLAELTRSIEQRH